MGSSNSGTQTQTTRSEPPSYLMPHLQQGMAGAQSLYQQGGPQPVPFSSQTQQALNMAQNRATMGSPVINAATNYTQNTLQGQGFMTPGSNGYAQNGGNIFSTGGLPNQFQSDGGQNQYSGMLGSMAQGGQNPYLDATFNQAARASQNQLTSEFARAGRNLDAREPIRADQLNNLATSIYGGAYENDAARRLSATQSLAGLGESQLGRQFNATEANLGRQFAGTEANLGRQFAGTEANLDRNMAAYDAERNRQQQLVPYASMLGNQAYTDIGQLANVGAQYEDYQRELNNQPGQNLDAYLARLSGFPGSTVTQAIPMERNRLAGALGGGMFGNQAFGPWGALGGALLGGMLG